MRRTRVQLLDGKARFTIQLSATRHAICDSCDKKLPVASCRKLSQAVAMHLSQKLKKVQLLRHATRDIHKWSTVSTLGARAVYVQCTCIVLLVHEDVANMKNIVNRVSLSQLVACVASRMSRRRKLYCESALRLMLDVLSKYSYSLYIGTLQVRHWSVAYYRWQFPIWRERFKYQLTEFAKYIRISGEISIVERFSNLFVSYETSQWVQSRLVKISYLYDWICLLKSGLFDL